MKFYFAQFKKKKGWFFFKIIHLHTGFRDYYLFWIINRKIISLLFIKL